MKFKDLCRDCRRKELEQMRNRIINEVERTSERKAAKILDIPHMTIHKFMQGIKHKSENMSNRTFSEKPIISEDVRRVADMEYEKIVNLPAREVNKKGRE